MRIVSFNINGIRARPHQLEALRDTYDPDVIGLQETKVADEAFPRGMVEDLGYHVIHYGQKGHYGVALLSKQPPLAVSYGLPSDGSDGQRRVIGAVYAAADGEQVAVLNGYFPQGESRDHPVKFPHKEQFYAELDQLLRSRYQPGQKLAVIGDMNVAPLDLDIGIGPDNAKRWLKTGKCSFLPEERAWLQTLVDWGLQDAYRACHPDVDDRFSWFDYRSRGFEREPRRGLRIDLVLATAPLAQCLTDSGIAYDIRSLEKPSDHCPVWADFDLG